ncbi:hypothetical protein GUITHDRAFT_157284 [Guillardia theta CCMP2712]|uniref:TIGR00297 family protein n=1 Tax=Guillardia theta (strain CCMP2712) TaxID=905079 RepID=L1JQB2_GUITC|nr:hypothetical protein GUITHDRAFT_157284 [Guillardia theta CCMP2712]EKX50469.1 hypothetical protein GUITHDRAFT_157284 [Guillardia theta CCMP2712]|eukprot:XP_005837449.1 hypothetical protein GUITHDRAFT_157284 [Guillardia theta CCMP2712]
MGILFFFPSYSLVLNSVLALLLLATGKYRSFLTSSGLLSAWLLGVILWGSLGFAGWSTCVVYLIAGSLVTKVKMAEKEKKGIAESRGGARGPENVWGSAATAAFCAMMATYSLQDTGLFRIGFVASLATKLSDTFASELGKAYGKKTFLITSMKPVPAGTEGAVSVEGTLAGVVGSLVIAVWAVMTNVMLASEIPVVMIAAFVATTCESVIGATVQDKYKWLTNEAVNAINTSIGAAVGILLFNMYH